MKYSSKTNKPPKMLKFRMGVLTVVYLFVAFISIITTTIIFQPSDVHPDYWVANKQDIIVQFICLAVYILAVLWQLMGYKKAKQLRTVNESRT